MFNKEEQRRRAAELSQQKIAAGVKVPVLPPIKVTPWPALKQPKAVKPTATPKGVSVEPFTNHLGQTIQPGQQVIAIASGYSHAVNVTKGTYIGLRRNPRGSTSSVSVAVEKMKYGYWDANGKDVGYNKAKALGVQYGKRAGTFNTALPGKRIYPTL